MALDSPVSQRFDGAKVGWNTNTIDARYARCVGKAAGHRRQGRLISGRRIVNEQQCKRGWLRHGYEPEYRPNAEKMGQQCC